MDGHTFISWNIPNFITVLLIALAGAVAFKAGSAAYSNWKAQQ